MLGIENLQNDLIRVTSSLQEKDGRYYAVLQYKDNQGKKQYKWKATKVKAEKGNKRNAQRIAEDIRQQFELELNTPVHKKETEILFGDYMLQWLETHKHNIEPSTYSSYEGRTKRTAKYFNELGIKLKELKTSDLKKYYNKLQQEKHNGKEIKYQTIKRYHANIHKALEDAIQLDLIQINLTKIKKNNILRLIIIKSN